MHRERGVTLIELMIAITLVAALSVGMLMAMRTSMITLEKTDSRLQLNRRVMSAEQILSREISGVMPVLGDCLNASGGVARLPIFNGTGQTLHLVSTYALAEGSRGSPRILELQVIPAQIGGFRLIVNEHLYSGPLSTATFCVSPAEANPQSFVLADRLVFCRFSYHEINLDSPQAGDWIPVWNKPNLPSAVRIEMGRLPGDPSGLPAGPVTIPIHITRNVGAPYDDVP
jgi:prepilin-type N-terminal cleavage/methylation domain-containing protein